MTDVFHVITILSTENKDTLWCVCLYIEKNAFREREKYGSYIIMGKNGMEKTSFFNCTWKSFIATLDFYQFLFGKSTI